MKRLQLALAATMLWAGVASAQPDLKTAPKGENPPNRNVAQQAKALKALRDTMQAREAKRTEARMERLPKMLTLLGVTDGKTQDAIVAHFNAVLKAREPMNDAQLQLRRALLLKVPDAQLKTALDARRAARKTYETNFQKTLDDLDAKIGYKKSSRLEAALLALGALEPDGVNTAP